MEDQILLSEARSSLNHWDEELQRRLADERVLMERARRYPEHTREGQEDRLALRDNQDRIKRVRENAVTMMV